MPKVIQILLIVLALASLIMFASVVADAFRFSFSASETEVFSGKAEVSMPPTPTPAPTPAPTPKPIPEDVKQMMNYIPQTASEIASRPGMFGRLVFPDTGIAVALFTDGPGETLAEKRQGICDAPDSAALYYDEEGAVIADHSNQGFSGLTQVQVGQKAYIITADSVLELICTGLIDGHNNDHKGIVDENYVPIQNIGDFICYTCKENWFDVRIVVLEFKDEYFAE